MIAALICVISVVVLLQFLISYSRSVIAAYRKSELSEQLREVVGIEDQRVGSEEFERLTQLLRLCPQKANDRTSVRVVGFYYGLLGMLRATARALAPQVSQWAERERAGCSYFAAVALDRRIAYSRGLLAQQMLDR